jgi:hypothetical protein
MLELIIGYFEQITVLTAICYAALKFWIVIRAGKPCLLHEIISALLTGSMIPTGVILIAGPFVPGLIETAIQNNIVLVAAGISIIFISIFH